MGWLVHGRSGIGVQPLPPTSLTHENLQGPLHQTKTQDRIKTVHGRSFSPSMEDRFLIKLVSFDYGVTVEREIPSMAGEERERKRVFD